MVAGITRRIKKAGKATVLAIGRWFPAVRPATRSFVARYRSRGYARLCRENPVDSKVVVFECYAGRAYACSPRALYQAMLADEAYADFEFVWVFRNRLAKALRREGLSSTRSIGSTSVSEVAAGDPPMEAIDAAAVAEQTATRRASLRRTLGAEALDELSRAKVVTYGSREYYRSYARAGTWIANNIIGAHLRPRNGQTFLQTWHGTPLKRLGCDLGHGVENATFSVREIHARYQHEGKRFTYLLSPSPFATEKLSTAFDLSETDRAAKIIEQGYPRNDSLFDISAARIERMRERLGLPADKKIVLYAPTFRDDQHRARVGFTYDADIDFDLLRREIGDDHIILFRAHYLVANDFEFDRYEGFVYDVSDISDIADLYTVSDMLVTDYSSVFFDYANLGKAIIFYMYDLKRYAEGLRGFYLNLSDLPGPIVQSESELVAEIQRAAHPSVAATLRLERFNERFSPHDDGHAAQRVLRTLFPSAHDDVDG